MRYKFPEQYTASIEYINKYKEKNITIEVTAKHPKRSLKQNNYLYLLLGFFGLEFGYTIEEAKQLYKRLNKDIYFYEKNGEKFIKSTADLDTKDMTLSIDIFRTYSAGIGLYLPQPDEHAFLNHIHNEIEKNKQYLNNKFAD